jgi:hypothetical protein
VGCKKNNLLDEQPKKKKDCIMNTVHKKSERMIPMSDERAKQIEAMSDEDIDFSDIPPLDEKFFQNTTRVVRKIDKSDLITKNSNTNRD